MATVSLTSEKAEPIQKPARNGSHASFGKISGVLERHAMEAHVGHSSGQTNRRRAERHRTLKHARIVLDNRMSTFDCIIRNISNTGAMLEISAPIGVPGHFELAIGTSVHGPTCTVRWRTDHAIGVSFDDAWKAAV
jgi:hypothetical protein